MRKIIAAALLCLSGAVQAHEGHAHGPRTYRMPSRPDLMTAGQARAEAEDGCLRASQRVGPFKLRLTYSGGEVTVECPAKAAVGVEMRVRF